MTKFAYNIYLLYYNKLVSNLIWTYIFATSYLCFRYNLGYLGNFLKVSFFAYNDNTYIAKISLVTREKKPSRNFLYVFSHLF